MPVWKCELQERAKLLSNKFECDKNDALKIWCFEQDTNEENVIFYAANRIQFLNETKDLMEYIFQRAKKEGAMRDKNMRGIKFDIHDDILHTYTIHRGGCQSTPTARIFYFVCELISTPRF